MLSVGLLNAQATVDEFKNCRERRQIVGECFKFRGRLALYNGGHDTWIWRVGTKHKYWVENRIYDIGSAPRDWDKYYWGEFQACPVTESREGSAQGICAKAIGKLKATKRKD